MSDYRLTVVIPTFNRPDGLLRAARSVFAQTLASVEEFTLLIVDNSPSASATGAIDVLGAECPDTVRLQSVHEPRPGVANARNAAMEAVETDLVAFLDDDQSATETWLEHLLATHSAFPASVVFSAVVAALPDGIKRHRPYFSAFFERQPDHQTGYVTEYYGAGNALVDFSRVPGCRPYFDAAMNRSGGEDDLLFQRIEEGGGKFAWSADTHVFEHPEPGRLTLGYTLRRAFAYGRAPVTLARKANPKRHLDVIFWIGVGGVKAIWHSLKWLILIAVGSRNHAFELDLAVRGIGKVLWFVDLHFYGADAVEDLVPEPDPLALQCSDTPREGRAKRPYRYAVHDITPPSAEPAHPEFRTLRTTDGELK